MAQTFEAAVAALLAEQKNRLPDLSDVTVLVPHQHVRAPFLAALRKQLPDTPVFLPPRFVTLPVLAASQRLQEESEPDSLRLVGLYGFLARIGWLAEAALWPQAHAMNDLLLDMDDALLSPPDEYADFAAQVEQAVRRRLPAPLDKEARMVFEVWRAYHQSGRSGRAIYAKQLALWSDAASGPLYSIGLQGLSRLEQGVLERCRESKGLKDLPVDIPYPKRHAMLAAAWRSGMGSLPERAEELARGSAASPLAVELAILAAEDMEQEAQAVAYQIKQWLVEGRRAIGVIALDRFAARRLRAVLERDAILMQDETGWTFSTASVSQVLDRWLALLQDDFYHRDLLDLLKSSFVFGDVEPEVRLDSIAALERLIAKRNAVSGVGQFIAIAQGEAEPARPLLERLARAAERFRAVRSQSLSDWLATLFAAFDDLGATGPIEADPAGRQLLDLLRRLQGELASDRSRFSLSKWRAWLNLQLDRTTFQETWIESPIRLTHLAAARLREFDAVVVLGADAGHLPPQSEPGMFGEAIRRQLGLPSRQQQLDEVRNALVDVLGRADRVLLSWQTRRGKEPNPASPWLLLLEALHDLAFGGSLRMQAVPPRNLSASVEPETAAYPRLTRLPERLSASGWQKLVSCPYRYFAHYDLGLGEAEEVAEEMEKADYGELVHAILGEFHALHPRLADESRERLQNDLAELSRQVFGQREERYYLARAWRQRWEKRIPSYIGWALEREAQGWRWVAAEREYVRELDLPQGRRVALYGRLDRLDDGGGGQAVIDYKTQSVTKLRGRLKTPGEDVQLPFYGALTGAAEAGLVALDDDPVRMVGLSQPLVEAGKLEAERIRQTLGAMLEGASLPANGAPETCAWCEMRGVCRRDVAAPETG